jgi:hypothetical protein
MFGNFPWNAWHVRRLPREDIKIHLQETHKRFLSDVEGAPIIGHEYLLGILCRQKRARCSFGGFREYLLGELVGADERIREVEHSASHLYAC